ncbi:ribosomal protein S7 domain-containing protein, partial [Filobasidium floriforme]|uniref:ribosomal protein S7 domain-containing protein n=1 Tax=Filobasidium floriforme TaxID=5210 RepID=UPI001E8EC101
PPRVDPLLDLFTNLLMKHGRKAEAQKRIGEVLDVIRQTTLSDPVPLMHQAIHLTSPSIRIVSLRRAAKNVPIPSALDARQRARTGISWILKAAEKGRKGGASERTGRIAKEVLAVLDGSSAALARKDEVHRLGAVNR